MLLHKEAVRTLLHSPGMLHMFANFPLETSDCFC